MPSQGGDRSFAESLFLPGAHELAAGTSRVRWVDPAPQGTPLGTLVRHAAERAAVTRLGVPVRRTVVRLRPATMRRGLRVVARNALASGALVAKAGDPVPAPGSALGRIGAEAGIDFVPPAFWLGSGGSLVVAGQRRGAPAMLRVFPASMLGQHGHGVQTLRHLGAAGTALVPRLLAAGHTDGLPWLVESRLPGRRPRQLTAALGEQALDFCLRLPPAPAPISPVVVREFAGLDVATVGRLRRLGEDAQTAWAGCPPVGVHGDFWTGNLLASRSVLRGVVDWDAYRSGAVPGVDLLHLVATDDRLRHRRGMGPELLSRPWTREPLRGLGRRYYDALGVRVDEDRWSAAGIDWWLGQVADTLTRTPELAADTRWTATNVTGVLDRLH